MSREMNVAIIVILTIIMMVTPVILKKTTWNKLLYAMNNDDFDTFFKTLDGVVCKYIYAPFNREFMRLSAYLAMGDDDKVENQIDVLLKMRMNNEQRASVVSRGFYHYLQTENVKKAKSMLDFGKDVLDPKAYLNLEIQYSVLLKKESKHIEDVKNILSEMWDGTSELNGTKKIDVGVMQYLIGLQYSYRKDVDHMMEYFEPAMENLKSTLYEEDMKDIISKLK